MIAWLLDGPESTYDVAMPGPGEPKRAILETYTKQYAAEYFSQAFIDLAGRLGGRLDDTAAIEKIVVYSNSNTHNFVGSGSGIRRSTTRMPAAKRWITHCHISSPLHCRIAAGTRPSLRRSRVTRPDTVALWQKISTIRSRNGPAAITTPTR